VIIVCPICQSKYKFDERKLGTAKSKKVKCPKCTGLIEVINEAPAVEPFPSGAEFLDQTVPAGAATAGAAQKKDAPTTAEVSKEALLAEAKARGLQEELVKMPEFRRFSLAVIQGNNAGEIFQITKPKMIIGRVDSDIEIKDLEASRQHARVEVIGERVILRDLDSTNGTFFNEERISYVNLENQSEFRIGTTVFMLIITDEE
jgi:predicted Zn finger-like uncharacterized protein